METDRKRIHMTYINLPVDAVRRYCEDIFLASGDTRDQSAGITDVLLTADLYGIESHGVQRLIRYCLAMKGGFILPGADSRIVFETPVSAVMDAPGTMGQLIAIRAMNLAIEKARSHGIGAGGGARHQPFRDRRILAGYIPMARRRWNQ